MAIRNNICFECFKSAAEAVIKVLKKKNTYLVINTNTFMS